MTTATSNATAADLPLRDARDVELTSRWKRWWFAPESPLNLAICRILFFGAELLYHAQIHFWQWGDVPRSLLKPVWIFERGHLPILPSSALLVMEVVWKLALVCACVGLFTRTAMVISAAGALYLLGVPFNFGKVSHLASIIIFTMGILAFSRSGDALSVDALIRRKRGLPPPAPSGEYRWPVRMVWVLMSVLFFAAGMAKIIRGGLDWALSENMAILLVQRHYMNDNSLPPLDWGLFIASHKPLYVTFAAASVLIETFCFLALFMKNPWRLILPLSLLGMQLGIGLLMRVWFTPFMIVYLFWVPWGDIVRWLQGRPAESTELTPAAGAASPA